MIKIIGVGDAGGHGLNRLIEEGIDGVGYTAINTYEPAFQQSRARDRILLGNGLGAGGNPQSGRQAAIDAHDDIMAAVSGAKQVFIIAAMGGGTGTGATPVVAQIAQETGANVVAVVTQPFTFEGVQRQIIAKDGIAALKPHADELVMIKCDDMMRLLKDKQMPSMRHAFTLVNGMMAWQVLSRLI